MKRTKIVCTIGPASAKSATLLRMIRAGMNVARLNFSHGTHESHAQTIRLVRAAANAANEPVAILGDLQGPKIRLGRLPEEGVELKQGSEIIFCPTLRTYNGKALPVTYASLHKEVKKGERILIDDGLMEVRVVSVRGANIHARVVNGGLVTSHKGMNFPDSTLRVSPITAKDRKDVVFAVKQGVDWIALSFVTSPDNVRHLRRLIATARKSARTSVEPKIIVKVEKREALERFAEILAETDAVMVARGDLGVETPAEAVPVHQKEIIVACRAAGKPVVVATQMLDSMIRNPRPTRAEVSDVANAVFDHADAVMLSGESATGKYPLEAVEMMAHTIATAEASPFDDVEPGAMGEGPEWAASRALSLLARRGRAQAALASLETAPWADRVLVAHPELPLFLATPNDSLARQANLRWGVWPFALTGSPTTFVSRAVAHLKKKKRLHPGVRLAVLVRPDHPGTAFDVI